MYICIYKKRNEVDLNFGLFGRPFVRIGFDALLHPKYTLVNAFASERTCRCSHTIPNAYILKDSMINIILVVTNFVFVLGYLYWWHSCWRLFWSLAHSCSRLDLVYYKRRAAANRLAARFVSSCRRPSKTPRVDCGRSSRSCRLCRATPSSICPIEFATLLDHRDPSNNSNNHHLNFEHNKSESNHIWLLYPKIESNSSDVHFSNIAPNRRSNFGRIHHFVVCWEFRLHLLQISRLTGIVES